VIPAVELAVSGGIHVVDDFEAADSPVAFGAWRIEAFAELDDLGDCRRLEIIEIVGPDGQSPTWSTFSRRLSRLDTARVLERLVERARQVRARIRGEQ
jgi:hypothetical protein